MGASKENYSVVNYKEGVLYFHPFIHGIRFEYFKEEKVDPVHINLFFDPQAIEKLLWFMGYVRKRRGTSSVTFRPLAETRLAGELFIDIPNFPVFSFAKNFGITRILEKDIAALDARVFSQFDIQVLEDEFYQFFVNQKSCQVKLNSVEPIMFEIQDKTLLEIDTEVVFPVYQ